MVVQIDPGDSDNRDPDSGEGGRRPHLDHIKGAFLASLNHEVRTPLSGIIGMLDLLSETQLDDDQNEYLNAARICTDSLAELLNATLEYSALEAGQFTLDESEFSVRETLDAAIAAQRGKAEIKELRLSLDTGGDADSALPETLVGDAPRIRELLGHLIANAIKFTHKGSVEVTASVVGDPEEQELLVVSVADTGIGIPTNRLEDIFDSFRQGEDGLSRAYPGLGLGLALAKKLTDVMGGEISVESRMGAGSTFIVALPVRRPQMAPESAAEPPAGEQGPVILAVEDNPVGLRVLRHVLERGGYRVKGAASGRQAIEIASSQRVDLILMDLQMPDINGLDAADAIRRLDGYQRVPIVALTANYSDQVRQQCLHHGMQAFLTKPVDAKELRDAVSRYLKVNAR